MAISDLKNIATKGLAFKLEIQRQDELIKEIIKKQLKVRQRMAELRQEEHKERKIRERNVKKMMELFG